MQYCESIFETRRWRTREVRVGNLGIGGDNPIRIQSMTTSDTRNSEATADQIMRLADSGCELVRVTVQGKKEAEACERIKNILLSKGYETPLVADIHFYPPAALLVADFVEKIRVNPGNFADKRASFKEVVHSDEGYASELERIEGKFLPLVEKCKKLDRALRIGTNHGSLSDRIMTRFGDSPLGMVESAFEFATICRKHDFHNFIFSMKSSNPLVMIHAYRLLVARMREMDWDYPLHLGVTEAGEGEDGRVKSAIGIGSLLLDGLGDTIRVSLTEDPWNEVDPCQRLRRLAETYGGQGGAAFEETTRNFQQILLRDTPCSPQLSLHEQGSVLSFVKDHDVADPRFFESLGIENNEDGLGLTEQSVDGVIVEHYPTQVQSKAKLRRLIDLGISVITPARVAKGVRLLTIGQLKKERFLDEATHRFAVRFSDFRIQEPTALWITGKEEEEWDSILDLAPSVILLRPETNSLHTSRKFFEFVKQGGIDVPVILCFGYVGAMDDVVIGAAAEMGALLCDGLGEGVAIEALATVDEKRRLGFNLLQGARRRSTKTEFISCPSCGRTLFDLQEVTQKIKARTGHLKGVKIAVMGCIVNGPGEMADADFGYVGSRAGKIDLYVGKECVEKDIDFEDAEDRLVDLIRSQGRWIEPSVQRLPSAS